MDPNGALAIVLTLSIPIVAIVAGVVSKWLKVRTEQQALRVSSNELEQKVERLEQANAGYAQRIEDLEAIVVSQTWNVLQEPGLSEPDRQRRIAAASRRETSTPAREEMNRQRAAQLARRLGG